MPQMRVIVNSKDEVDGGAGPLGLSRFLSENRTPGAERPKFGGYAAGSTFREAL